MLRFRPDRSRADVSPVDSAASPDDGASAEPGAAAGAATSLVTPVGLGGVVERAAAAPAAAPADAAVADAGVAMRG